MCLFKEEFLGKRRPIASESKASLEKLLTEARENEAGYLAELKKARAPLTEEDRMLVRTQLEPVLLSGLHWLSRN